MKQNNAGSRGLILDFPPCFLKTCLTIQTWCSTAKIDNVHICNIKSNPTTQERVFYSTKQEHILCLPSRSTIQERNISYSTTEDQTIYIFLSHEKGTKPMFSIPQHINITCSIPRHSSTLFLSHEKGTKPLFSIPRHRNKTNVFFLMKNEQSQCFLSHHTSTQCFYSMIPTQSK